MTNEAANAMNATAPDASSTDGLVQNIQKLFGVLAGIITLAVQIFVVSGGLPDGLSVKR